MSIELYNEQEVCPHCQQTLYYRFDIDKGSCEILKKMVRFIKDKGINAVHPHKEMAKAGIITSRELDNIARLKSHGLVAHIKGERGNYCITNKAFDFLGGEPIPRTVAIKKKTKGQRSHVVAHSDEEVTIDMFGNEWNEYWSANGYTITEGRVINEPPVKGKSNKVIEI